MTEIAFGAVILGLVVVNGMTLWAWKNSQKIDQATIRNQQILVNQLIRGYPLPDNSLEARVRQSNIPAELYPDVASGDEKASPSRGVTVVEGM